MSKCRTIFPASFSHKICGNVDSFSGSLHAVSILQEVKRQLLLASVVSTSQSNESFEDSKMADEKGGIWWTTVVPSRSQELQFEKELD